LPYAVIFNHLNIGIGKKYFSSQQT